MTVQLHSFRACAQNAGGQLSSCYSLLHGAAVTVAFFVVRPQVLWEGGVCVLSLACGWNASTMCKAPESHAYNHDTPSVPGDHVG
jgi:hypothetical protein